MRGVTVQRTSELLALGLNQRDLCNAQTAGLRTKVRHGAYVDAAAGDAVGRHRHLIAATWPLLAGHTVISHASAGLLHGLPTWDPLLERVWVTRQTGHGKRTKNLVVTQAALSEIEVTEQFGYRLTSLERTAADYARTVNYVNAVAVLDAALHSGAELGLLSTIIDAARHRKGAATARRALEFADPRAESVGESLSRAVIAQLGLPAPVLQYEVVRDGVWLARTDFAWPQYRLIGEFDGRIKYLGTSSEVADTVMREKRRQSAIEAAGWTVVRWTWSDLTPPTTLHALLSPHLTPRSA